MPLGTHFYYLSALTVVRGLVSNYRQTQRTIVRSPARASIAGVERSHAVVLGSSFAGLFTASVLADQGWRVTLIEKDVLEADAGGVDSDAVQRRLRGRIGVPQARHLHTLLASGARAAEEILPGVLDDLVAAGGERIDFCAAGSVKSNMGGMWRESSLAAGEGIGTILASRPLDHRTYGSPPSAGVQKQLISLRSGERVAGLLGGNVTGVRLSTGEEITSELTVDASGRGSRSWTLASPTQTR